MMVNSVRRGVNAFFYEPVRKNCPQSYRFLHSYPSNFARFFRIFQKRAKLPDIILFQSHQSVLLRAYTELFGSIENMCTLS